MAGKFDSIEQLYNDLTVEWHEYEFTYKGKEYYLNPIMIDNKIGFDIGECGNFYLVYNTFDELLDKFIVDGKSFREFILDVDVTIEL